MAVITSTFSRDGNRVPIWTDGIITGTAVTYAATTTGATGTAVIFTVTGDVIANVIGVCGTTMTSGGSPGISVGIVGNTAGITASMTGTATAGQIFVDATPATIENIPTAKILIRGTDIIQEITGTAITGGTMTYYCLWRPMSSDGNVTA